MKFTKINIKNIKKEKAHCGSGSRKVLVKPKKLTSKYFEAMTKGFLNPGYSYDWHSHKDIDEIFIVLKGQGKFYWKKEVTKYVKEDIFTIPANSKHKITAEGNTPSEYYFLRIKTR